MPLRRGGSAVASKPDRTAINRVSLSSLRTRPGVHLLVVVLLISVPLVRATTERLSVFTSNKKKERKQERTRTSMCKFCTRPLTNPLTFPISPSNHHWPTIFGVRSSIQFYSGNLRV
jgi:hypothetical protein